MTYKQKLLAIDTVMTCSHQDEIWQWTISCDDNHFNRNECTQTFALRQT